MKHKKTDVSYYTILLYWPVSFGQPVTLYPLVLLSLSVWNFQMNKVFAKSFWWVDRKSIQKQRCTPFEAVIFFTQLDKGKFNLKNNIKLHVDSSRSTTTSNKITIFIRRIRFSLAYCEKHFYILSPELAKTKTFFLPSLQESKK